MSVCERYVTLVGSRNAPKEVLDVAALIGQRLLELGLIRRSGGARGMDRAWLRHQSPTDEIYRPDRYGINIHDQLDPTIYYKLAESLVPHWNYCDEWAKSMHARNTCQVLGLDLQTPSEFLLFYAKESKSGNVSGGTRTAVELARREGIPVFNLMNESVLMYWLKRLNIAPKTNLLMFT